MNYLSVCSGIEAATVAWHHMGWKPIGFSEIEKFPSQVLAHHYPQVTNFGDMTKYKEWKLDDSIGLLVGGTPCQSFSVAGLRKGLEDPRGNLALTYVGILDKFRPKWCIWENVPGVLSSGEGRDFGAFLGALGELGYGWAYRVLDAQNFGVAQRRRRVFVVGCVGSWESAAKVLFESESLSGDIKKGRKSGEEIAATITARFGNSRNNHEELAPVWPATTASTLNASFGDKLGLENQHINSGAPLFVPSYVSDVSSTLTASGAGFSRPGQTSTAHENYVAQTVVGALCARDYKGIGNQYVKEGKCIVQPIPIHDQATRFTGSNNGKGNGLGIGKPGDPMNTLDTSSRHAVACIGGQHPNAAIGEEISPTLTNAMGAGGGHVPVIGFDAYNSAVTGNVSKTLDTGSDYHHVPNVYSPTMAVRRLTEVECERLQGFPDNYTNIKENCPSGARYKALGNSMAVPVMRWIGERINNYERP
jgi:DNA (cytosine-5)-methyltransferase 1